MVVSTQLSKSFLINTILKPEIICSLILLLLNLREINN